MLNDAQERKDSIEALIEMLEAFEIKFDEIISDARDIAKMCRSHGGHVETAGKTMEYYFVNRMKSFIEGYEQFKFDNLKETLQEELEEIKAGVYGELEEE